MKLTCNICNECFDKCNKDYICGHLKIHSKKLNKDYNIIRIEYILFNFPDFNSKEKFEKIYNENSIPDFKKKYNLGQNDLKRLCEHYNIKRRTIQDTNGSGGMCHIRAEKTNYEKYGAKNVLSKGTLIYEKRNKTVQEKYGVSNVFEIKEIKDKLKSDEFWLEKYGLTISEFKSKIAKEHYNLLSDDEKTEWLERTIHKAGVDRFKTIKHNSHSTSSIENKVKKFLIDLDYGFIQQKRLQIKSRRYYFYDICIEPLKLMIEINGSYWHANPQIYKKDDIINYPGYSITAYEKWQNDILKEDYAIKNGYRVIVIWDNELEKCKTTEQFKLLLFQKLTELENNGYSYLSGRNPEQFKKI